MTLCTEFAICGHLPSPWTSWMTNLALWHLSVHSLMITTHLSHLSFLRTIWTKLDGKTSQSVEFTRDLHVPSLQNNLLSCLFLGRYKHIVIHINSEQMDFSLNGKSLFCAPIRSYNCATLSGATAPLSDSTNWVSTLPLPPSLWHRRCCHHNLVDIAKMQKDNLVTCMTFASSQKPDVWALPCWQDALQLVSFISIAFYKTAWAGSLWPTWSSSGCHLQRLSLLDHIPRWCNILLSCDAPQTEKSSPRSI